MMPGLVSSSQLPCVQSEARKSVNLLALASVNKRGSLKGQAGGTAENIAGNGGGGHRVCWDFAVRHRATHANWLPNI